MPTTYTDQFFIMDPGIPPAVGTSFTVQTGTYIDNDDNGQISPTGGDSYNGLDITSVWENDTITVVMNGVTVTITGVTFYMTGGPAVFTPTDGTVLSNATFVSSTFVTSSTQVPVGSFGPPCFVVGTLIETEDGPRPIEDLEVGDMVMTLDRGLQPIRWLGHRTVAGEGDFAPIRFAEGVLGNRRELLVSAQHRMLISGWRAELFYGQDEVLVAAKYLVNDSTTRPCPMRRVTYYHLLFDQHEVVEAEGIPSESFHPGEQIMAGDQGMRDELIALFPELASEVGRAARSTARTVLKRHEATLLN